MNQARAAPAARAWSLVRGGQCSVNRAARELRDLSDQVVRLHRLFDEELKASLFGRRAVFARKVCAQHSGRDLPQGRRQRAHRAHQIESVPSRHRQICEQQGGFVPSQYLERLLHRDRFQHLRPVMLQDTFNRR